MTIEPIQKHHQSKMQEIAKFLHDYFNNDNKTERVGFALFIFDFYPKEEKRINYISNAQRPDMIAAIREWLAQV